MFTCGAECTCGAWIIRPSGATWAVFSNRFVDRCRKAEVDSNVLGRLLSLYVHQDAKPLLRNEVLLHCASKRGNSARVAIKVR
jgi:hypothetical protein